MQSNPNDNHHNKQNQKQTNKNYCMFQKTDMEENSDMNTRSERQEKE
jgi:hypothetical protein